jgi:hypothetical protein
MHDAEIAMSGQQVCGDTIVKVHDIRLADTVHER